MGIVPVEYWSIELEFRDRKGSAPASVAVFRALAENSVARERFECSCQCRAQDTGREARPATPGAGVLPNSGLLNSKTPRIWKSAIQQAWKPALQLNRGSQQIDVK